MYADQTVTLDTRREHITFAPFTAPDRTSVLDVDPERVSIVDGNGQALEERADPRETFPAGFDDLRPPGTRSRWRTSRAPRPGTT